MRHLALEEIYFLPTALTKINAIRLHVYCLYMCASKSLLFQSNTFSVGNYFNNKAFALDVVTRSLKWRPVYCYKLPSVEWPTNHGLTLLILGSDRRMWSGEFDFPWLRQTLLQQNVPVWCEPQDCHNTGSHCHRFGQKPETNYENQVQIMQCGLTCSVVQPGVTTSIICTVIIVFGLRLLPGSFPLYHVDYANDDLANQWKGFSGMKGEW